MNDSHVAQTSGGVLRKAWMYQWTIVRATRRREPCIHAPTTPITTLDTMQMTESLTVIRKPLAKRLRSN